MTQAAAVGAPVAGAASATRPAPASVRTGWRPRVIRARIWARVVRVALRCYPGPWAAARALRAYVARLQAVRPTLPVAKYVHAADRWFFAFDVPGFPSRAFDRFVEGELDRATPFRPGPPSLHTAIVAVTRRCPLRCQHCSDWQVLNGPEVLSVDDLRSLAAALRDRGLSHLQLSGGEPLQRLDAVEAVAREVAADVETWVLTSGHGLVPGVAARLRRAGVAGVHVSLDDWRPAAHDAFRGVPGTFERATAAVRNARAAGLGACLNLTARREFVTPENLDRYAALARDLGVGFIQVLEPRAVGRWESADVELRPPERALLERFQRALTRERSDMPIVAYAGELQRRLGCSGAADRYLFVDALGGVHACPFCRGAVARLGDGLDLALERLAARGCHAFESARARERRYAPPAGES